MDNDGEGMNGRSRTAVEEGTYWGGLASMWRLMVARVEVDFVLLYQQFSGKHQNMSAEVTSYEVLDV